MTQILTTLLTSISLLAPVKSSEPFLDTSGQQVVTQIVEVKNKPESRQEVIDFLVQSGEGANVDTWLYIMEKESNFCYYDYALHSNDFRGCTQLYIGTWNWLGCQGDILNWRDNLTCSFKIRDVQGFGAWEVISILN